MGAQPKYPWHTVRKEYVEGIRTKDGHHWPALNELAEKHGINPSTVRQRSSQENWVAKRALFQTQLEQRSREKKMDKLADEAAGFDRVCLQGAKAGINEALKVLAEIGRSKKKTLSGWILRSAPFAVPKRSARKPWARALPILICLALLMPWPVQPGCGPRKPMALASEVKAFDFRPFSPKARKLISWWMPESPHAEKDMVIADGSVRSGKTISGLLGFTSQTLAQFKYQSFIVAGRTMGALERNVIVPWKQILAALGLKYSETRSDVRSIKIGTNTYYCFGAATEKSQDVLQGLTAAGAYLDDFALFPRSFVEQVKARCSVEGAKIWGNCNPQGPYHYVKTEYIDQAEQQNILRLHFTMADNWSLPDSVRERYERQFTGLWHKRFVQGLWVMAEGIVYDAWSDDLVVPCPASLPRSIVGVDYGTTNPTTFGLYRWSDFDPVHLAREYWFDSAQAGHQKTDGEYADDLERWLGSDSPEAIYVDPSAAGFIQELKRRGLRVKAANNDVVDGIRFVAGMIARKCYLVDPSCEQTRQEFVSYCWDPKAQEKGEDRPIKKDDHAMDRDRYALYSHFGAKRTVRVAFV